MIGVALLYIASIVIKKNIRQAYTNYHKVTKLNGIRTSLKGVAYITMVELLQDLDEDTRNECFQEIDKVVVEGEDDLLNNIDFMLSVSHAYDLQIMNNKDRINKEKITTWSEIANSFRKRAELMAPEDKNVVSANITCINKYIVLQEYDEAIHLCDNCLVEYQKILLNEQKNAILYFKAKALMESSQIKEAYKIYQSIIDNYSMNDDLTKLTYFFNIHFDLGRCHQNMGESKKALKSFKRSLEILSQLNFDKGLKEEKEKQLLIHFQDLEDNI